MSTSADDEPGITLMSRHAAGENQVFSLFFDHVADARGNEATRYLSVIPKHLTRDGISGVAVLPVFDGSVGLIRVYRHPLACWGWEAPKGFINAGETSQQAAVRELGEETGYRVPVRCLRQLGIVAPEAGVIQAMIEVYAAAVEGHDVGCMEPAGELGHGKVRFFDSNEISALVSAGQIRDACTLSMLYLHSMRTL